MEVLKSHGIPGERICVELTIDQKADDARLEECFEILRSYGISVLLDQFGVTVCNLKNVLNMSFDSVKINRHMVQTFCDGKNRQLGYMVHMLNARNWTLYLDGIDNIEMLEFLSDMKVDYIQGMAVGADSVGNTAAKKGLPDEVLGGEPIHV